MTDLITSVWVFRTIFTLVILIYFIWMPKNLLSFQFKIITFFQIYFHSILLTSPQILDPRLNPFLHLSLKVIKPTKINNCLAKKKINLFKVYLLRLKLQQLVKALTKSH